MKCFAIIALAAAVSVQAQAPTTASAVVAPVVTQITDGQIQAPPNATVPPPFNSGADSSAVSYISAAIGAVAVSFAALL